MVDQPVATQATNEDHEGAAVEPPPDSPAERSPATDPEVKPQGAVARRPPRRRRGRPSRARGQPNSSDDATARWTVRGVPSPVREMALRGAEARGMTVGDWVAEAIVALARAADKTNGGSGPKLPTTDPPPDIGQILQRLDDRLTRLEERQTQGIFGRLFRRRA